MINFRPTYEPLIKFCKELIAEKKALMEENEKLKEKLKRTEFYLLIEKESNQKITEILIDHQKEKRKDLEKRVEYLKELLTPEEPAEEKLEVDKWYDARTFDEATLKKLLKVGTFVNVLTDWQEDEKRDVPKVDDCLIVTAFVTSVEGETTGWDKEETAVYVDRYKIVPNYWFKILKEY